METVPFRADWTFAQNPLVLPANQLQVIVGIEECVSHWNHYPVLQFVGGGIVVGFYLRLGPGKSAGHLRIGAQLQLHDFTGQCQRPLVPVFTFPFLHVKAVVNLVVENGAAGRLTGFIDADIARFRPVSGNHRKKSPTEAGLYSIGGIKPRRFRPLPLT